MKRNAADEKVGDDAEEFDSKGCCALTDKEKASADKQQDRDKKRIPISVLVDEILDDL